MAPPVVPGKPAARARGRATDRDDGDLVGPCRVDHPDAGRRDDRDRSLAGQSDGAEDRAAEGAGRDPGEHGHSDHVGNAAELAKKTGAKVITSYELASLIGAANSEG